MSDKNLQDIKDTITEAGKALLSYSKTGSAFLPLDGDMYVAVGTLAGMASVAGKEVGESASAAAGTRASRAASLREMRRSPRVRTGAALHER